MINATWGTPEHSQKRDVRIVSIPVLFSTEVVVEHASVFQIEAIPPLEDVDIEELDAFVNGDGKEHRLAICLPADVEGEVRVSIVGKVFHWEKQKGYSVKAEPLSVRLNTSEM